MLEAVDHVNLVVADLEAMLRFYRDVLGLKVTKQVTISGKWIEKVVGLEDVEAEVIYLNADEGARVELIRYISPPGTRPQHLEQPHTQGLRHLAFRVTDIDATAAKLRGAGVELVSDVQRVPDDQVTYTGGVRKRLIYFHDPEGNLLELCEYR